MGALGDTPVCFIFILKRSATVIHTSLVETEVGRNYPVDLASVASIKVTTTVDRPTSSPKISTQP